MDIGPKRRTVSIGILRRKIYALICCNIFLVITKCCYGKMTIQTCIHTTCPSITKSAIEVIPRRRNAKIRSKPEIKIWNLLCFGIRNLHRQNPESNIWNPESTAWNPESNTVLDYLTWGDFTYLFRRETCKFVSIPSIYRVYASARTYYF